MNAGPGSYPPNARSGRWPRATWLSFAVLACAARLWAQAGPGAAPPAETRLPEYQQRVFRAALQAVRPSLVRIDTIGGARPLRAAPLAGGTRPPGFRQADGPTSGLIWSSDGYIVTSSFNFIRDPSIITVTLYDRRRFVARLVARDRPARLALLKIEASGLPAPRLLSRAQLRPGQWALAAGCGHGGDAPVVSVGIISALARMSGRAIQTDAKTSPANYGGPLFDIAGRVMGICVPLGPGDDELAGVQWYDSGIGFAVDTDLIRDRLPRLKDGVDLQRGVLGVALDARPPVVGLTSGDSAGPSPADGLRIDVVPHGPAAQAGLRKGDVILRLDDTPVRTVLRFRRALARKAAGDRVVVTYRRGAEVTAATLTLTTEEALATQPAAESP